MTGSASKPWDFGKIGGAGHFLGKSSQIRHFALNGSLDNRRQLGKIPAVIVLAFQLGAFGRCGIFGRTSVNRREEAMV